MAKIQNTDTPNADEDLDQQKLLFSARGIRNDTATMETTLTVSYKTIYKTALRPRSSTPM